MERNVGRPSLEIGREQAKIVEDEKPARRFLGVLYTIIAQGRVTLLPKDETPGEPRPGVDFIGWRDDDFLYLLPEATYAAVVRFCWDTREYFPSRQERLKRDLAKEKISECDPGRFTTTARIDNHTRRVLKLSLNQIKELLGEDITDHHQYHHFKMGERDGL